MSETSDKEIIPLKLVADIAFIFFPKVHQFTIPIAIEKGI